MRLTRRDAITGLAAAPLVGCATPAEGLLKTAMRETGSSGLDQIAQSGGRRFGSAVAWNPQGTGMAVTNPLYAEVLRAECGVIVPENEMKWQALRPSATTYDFAAMDAIAGWAQANSMDLRAHVLLWHRPEWFPQWLNTYDFGNRPASEAGRLLVDHIDTVTQRYGAQIRSWDVVNEAIDHATNAPIKTSLSRAMGSAEAVIDLAFHTARERLPGAQLVYNDYMSWEPAHAGHCDAVLRLLEGMKARGVPCDALGIQSHIEILEIDPATRVGPYDEAGWRRFLDEVTGMGYRLIVTELDVKDAGLPADFASRDRAVAEFIRRYFDVLFDYADYLDDIVAWGMVDRFNWLQYFDNARRADSLEVRGCPYDSNYQPKLMRAAIAEALVRQRG